MNSINPQEKHIAYKEWKELGIQIDMLNNILQIYTIQRYQTAKDLNEIIKEQNDTHGLMIAKADELRDIFNNKSEELEDLIGDDWEEVSAMGERWSGNVSELCVPPPVDRGGEGPLSIQMTGEQ